MRATLKNKETRKEKETFKTVDTNELAKKLGVDYGEIELKHKLIDDIIKAQKDQELSQEDLGKLLELSQGYISRLLSKNQTRKVTIDQLLKILSKLGHKYTLRAVGGTRAKRPALRGQLLGGGNAKITKIYA